MLRHRINQFALWKQDLNRFAFRQFFSFIKLVDVEGNLLVFAVPTKFIYEQIEGTYLELFREALYEQFPDADVKYNINETYFK